MEKLLRRLGTTFALLAMFVGAPSILSKAHPDIIPGNVPYSSSYMVFFARNNSQITPTTRRVLVNAIKDQASREIACVQLVAFADPGELAPLALSKARAQAVAAELHRDGLNVLIETAWFGAERPMSLPDEANYKPGMNMRTEVRWHVRQFADVCTKSRIPH